MNLVWKLDCARAGQLSESSRRLNDGFGEQTNGWSWPNAANQPTAGVDPNRAFTAPERQWQGSDYCCRLFFFGGGMRTARSERAAEAVTNEVYSSLKAEVQQCRLDGPQLFDATARLHHHADGLGYDVTKLVRLTYE